MQAGPQPEDDSGLPPPGQRWGAGARSVLPYLTKSLQAKPAETPQAREARLQEDSDWKRAGADR